MTRGSAKPKAKRGAPREHDRGALRLAFHAYIKRTQIPIVSEFAYKQGLHRQLLYDMPELADAVKECITKQETALERLALKGKVNCSMAIFSLKQIGWSDKQETTHKGDPSAPLQLILNGSDVNG